MRKSKRKRRFVLTNPKRLLEIIGVFFLYLTLVFCRGQWRLIQLRREAQQNREKIVQLAQHNNQLRKECKKLEADQYVETVAREELGLVKEGEILYRFAEAEEGKLKAFRPAQIAEE